MSECERARYLETWIQKSEINVNKNFQMYCVIWFVNRLKSKCLANNLDQFFLANFEFWNNDI